MTKQRSPPFAPELSMARDRIAAAQFCEGLPTYRINTFDAEQVERMILDVTGRHLKWINYFGVGLGTIIGLSQVALRLFT